MQPYKNSYSNALRFILKGKDIMATFEDMQKAYYELQASICKEFNAESGGPIKSLGIDAEAVLNNEHGLAIVLNRKLTKEEKEKLPNEYNGVKIRYLRTP